eukprot:2000754-Karenia_brevis.AAC.1
MATNCSLDGRNGRKESLCFNMIIFSAAILACEQGGPWESGSTEMRLDSFLLHVISFDTAISACVKVGGGSVCRKTGARRARRDQLLCSHVGVRAV